LRVCRVEAAPVLKFVQDALAKRLSIKTSMSSKLRIFPARRREAFGRTVTLKMKLNDFEIITRSRSVPLGGRDPTSLGEPEPQSPL
jgi:hypothetical protein